MAERDGVRQTNFFVPGVPAPQGSKRHVGNGILVESSKALGPWRDAVTVVARAMHRGPPISPAGLDVTFHLPVPKRRTREFPTVRPDLDKLLRGVFDGLTTAGVVQDDSVIVAAQCWKVYAGGSEDVGATVRVYEHDGDRAEPCERTHIDPDHIEQILVERTQLRVVSSVAWSVVKEWDRRGDNGCSRDLQGALRLALKEATRA